MAVLDFDDIFGKDFKSKTAEITKSMLELAEAQRQLQMQAQKTNEQIERGNTTRQEAASTNKEVAESLDEVSQYEKELQKIMQKTSQIISQINAERSEEYKELERAKQARAEQNKKIKEEIKLEAAEIGSIARLRAENKKLRQERDNINASTEEGTQRIRQLNDQINANDEIIRNNSDALVQQKINVGNYESALDALPGVLGEVSGSVKGLGAQFMALLANPVVAFLAAIAGAVYGLGKLFTSTRAGNVEFQKSFTGLSSNIDIAKKRLRENTVEIVNNAKENGVLQAGYDAIKNKISDYTDRVKKNAKENGILRTVLEQVVDVSSPLVGIIKGQISANEGQVESLKKVKDELIDLQNALIDTQQILTQDIQQNQNNADIQSAIADDATRSFQERKSAAEQARKFTEASAKAQIELSNAELEVQQKIIEQAKLTGDVSEETGKALTETGIEIRQAYIDAYLAAREAEAQYQLAVLENSKQRAELKQDDFEQELDFLLDVVDATKTTNEAKIKDDKRTLSERKAILQETRSLLEESYNQQIDLFKREFDVELDRTALKEKNNKEAFEYARGLGLSEIATNGLLEVIKERKFAEQDLADLQVDLNSEYLERIQAAEAKIKSIDGERKERQIKDLDELEAYRVQKENDEYARRVAAQQEEFASFVAMQDKMLAEIEVDETLSNEIKLQKQAELDEALKEMQDLSNAEYEAAQAEHEEALYDIKENFRKKNEEREKEELTKFSENLVQYAQLLSEFTDFRLSEIDNEISGIEKARDSEIKAAEDAGKDTTKIEEKYNKKIEELEREKAIKAKNQAIISSVINTAVAVTKVLANPIMATLVGIAGAIQTATISAQPLSAFKDGGVMEKDGFARYSEIGREIMIKPSGKVSLTPNKETIGFVEKGTKFIPNWETEKILQGGSTIERYEKESSKQPIISTTEINGDKITKTVRAAMARIKREDIYYRL